MIRRFPRKRSVPPEPRPHRIDATVAAMPRATTNDDPTSSGTKGDLSSVDDPDGCSIISNISNCSGGSIGSLNTTNRRRRLCFRLPMIRPRTHPPGSDVRLWRNQRRGVVSQRSNRHYHDDDCAATPITIPNETPQQQHPSKRPLQVRTISPSIHTEWNQSSDSETNHHENLMTPMTTTSSSTMGDSASSLPAPPQHFPMTTPSAAAVMVTPEPASPLSSFDHGPRDVRVLDFVTTAAVSPVVTR